VRKVLCVLAATGALALGVPAGAVADNSSGASVLPSFTLSFTCGEAAGLTTYTIYFYDRFLFSFTVTGECVSPGATFHNLQELLAFLRSLHP
jgi:hypothetical protein